MDRGLRIDRRGTITYRDVDIAGFRKNRVRIASFSTSNSATQNVLLLLYNNIYNDEQRRVLSTFHICQCREYIRLQCLFGNFLPDKSSSPRSDVFTYTDCFSNHKNIINTLAIMSCVYFIHRLSDSHIYNDFILSDGRRGRADKPICRRRSVVSSIHHIIYIYNIII